MKKAKARTEEKETVKERKVSKERSKAKVKEAKRENHMVENPHHGDLGNQGVIHGHAKDIHFMTIQLNNRQKEAGAASHPRMTIGSKRQKLN